MHALAFDHFDAGVGDDVESAAAGADFMDVALEPFDQRVVRRDGDDRYVVEDPRQGTVPDLAPHVVKRQPVHTCALRSTSHRPKPREIERQLPMVADGEQVDRC